MNAWRGWEGGGREGVGGQGGGGETHVSKMLMLLLVTAVLLEMAHEIKRLLLFRPNWGECRCVCVSVVKMILQNCRRAHGLCPSAQYCYLFCHCGRHTASYVCVHRVGNLPDGEFKLGAGNVFAPTVQPTPATCCFSISSTKFATCLS